MGQGGSKKPHAIKKDRFDFELQPFVLGWQHEEQVRANGIKLTDFEFFNPIGISMFGFVVLVRHRASGNYVACKVLRKKEVIRFKQVQSMQLEREIMGELNHPFIARCGGAFQDATRLYLVTELCPGGDLYTRIQRTPKKRLPDKAAKFYAASVVMALQYLHNRDLAYRALCTENCCIDADGYLKLVDFQQVAGLVERPNRGRSEFTGKRLKSRECWTVAEHPGPELVHKSQFDTTYEEVYMHHRRRTTPQYFAPEVVGLRRHGKEVDWWSLGVLIAEMLCGYPPYLDSGPSGLYHKIMRLPVELPVYVMPVTRDLILQLMDKRPLRFFPPRSPPQDVCVMPVTRDVILQLMDKRPLRRLGYAGAQEVIDHSWFSNYPWQRLLYKRQTPPFVPDLLGPTDTKYFHEYPNSITDHSAEGDTKAGALFKGYDDTDAPPITLLPPRHCMYNLAPGAQPTASSSRATAAAAAADEDDQDGGPAFGASKKKLTAAEEADEATIMGLCQSYGVTVEVATKVLKKNKFNVDKAAEELERGLDVEGGDIDQMLVEES